MSKSNRDLAMAYAVKTRTGKKMAEGGPVSVKAEKLPSTQERNEDSKEIGRNEGKKPLRNSDMTSRPDKASLKGLRTTPIKHPSAVPSSVISTRLRSEEDDLRRSAKVNNGPQEQPMRSRDEEEAHKKGPSTPSLKMKMMAKGGMINELEPMHDAEEDDQVDPHGLESDDDQEPRPEKEFMAGEMEPRYAEGGEVDDMNQPMDEEELDHHASIAAAIMARKEKQMMAEGGVIEDPNKEHAETYDHDDEEVLKENYDAGQEDEHTSSHDDEDGHKIEGEDSHDMISRIMKRMRTKSPMVK